MRKKQLLAKKKNFLFSLLLLTIDPSTLLVKSQVYNGTGTDVVSSQTSKILDLLILYKKGVY